MNAQNYFNLIMLYAECGYNARAALREYRARYPPPHPSNPQVVTRAVYRVRENRPIVPRTSTDDQRGGRSRRVPVHLEEDILRYFDENPRASSRQAGRHFGVNHRLVLRVLKINRRRPFRAQRVQAMLPRDLPVRAAYCRWLLDAVAENPQFVHQVIWSDECTFTRNGLWNRRNEHYWSVDNPRVFRQTAHQQRWSINTWCGIHGNNIIGPIFLPPTLNRHGYVQVLNDNVANYVNLLPPEERRSVWFQQDGAPAHSVREVREALNDIFGDQWIGRFGPHRWPPRSPDLTPLDFFLWGTMKDRVFHDECETREEMVQRLLEAFSELRRQNEVSDILSRVHRHTIERARLCLQRGGGHFEHRL